MEKIESLSERITIQKKHHFMYRHWHILCIGFCLLVAFILVGLDVTQWSLHIQYPTWLTIPWILLNILLFFSSMLLSLSYLLRLVRVKWNNEKDVRASLALFATILYLAVGFAIVIGGWNSAFSWVTLFYLFMLFILDVIDIVLGIP